MDPKSVSVKGSELTATLRNPAADKQFVLKLTSYKGLVMLHIDESGDKGRFQVCLSLVKLEFMVEFEKEALEDAEGPVGEGAFQLCSCGALHGAVKM